MTVLDPDLSNRFGFNNGSRFETKFSVTKTGNDGYTTKSRTLVILLSTSVGAF
jgi:hypothetical protein